MCLGHRSSHQQKTGVKPTHLRHAESTFRWMGAEWASQCETTRYGVDRHRFLGRKQDRFGSEFNVAHAYLSRRCWPLKFLNCSIPIPTFGHPMIWLDPQPECDSIIRQHAKLSIPAGLGLHNQWQRWVWLWWNFAEAFGLIGSRMFQDASRYAGFQIWPASTLDIMILIYYICIYIYIN